MSTYPAIGAFRGRGHVRNKGSGKAFTAELPLTLTPRLVSDCDVRREKLQNPKSRHSSDEELVYPEERKP